MTAAPFQGWQRQANGPSVQAAVEAALLACSGETVTVVAAGRTDAGVHALGQVAHVDLGRDWRRSGWSAHSTSTCGRRPIAVLEAREAPPDFHARFSCTGRRYLYRILTRRSPPALERGRVWHVPSRSTPSGCTWRRRLWSAATTSPASAPANASRASPVKTLGGIHVERRGELIECRLWARSFLHHQVRNIVGTLKTVGEGKAPIAHARTVLAARDRAAAGPTAPAEGLFLTTAEFGTRQFGTYNLDVEVSS